MSQKVEEARQALADARENLRVVQKNITGSDAASLMAGKVETVELLAKQQAQHEAMLLIVKAEKELIAAHAK